MPTMAKAAMKELKELREKVEKLTKDLQYKTADVERLEKFLKERYDELEELRKTMADATGGQVEFLIVRTGGGNLGRCYNSMTYKIVSSHKLTDEQIHQLRAMHICGYGQEFYIRNREEDPTPWSSGPHKYYVESRVDSSD